MLFSIVNSWWSFDIFLYWEISSLELMRELRVNVSGFCSHMPWKGMIVSVSCLCQAVPVSHTDIHAQHSSQNSPLENVNNAVTQVHRPCVVEICTLSLQMVHYPANVLLSMHYSRLNRRLDRCPRSWRKVVPCSEVQLDRSVLLNPFRFVNGCKWF